MVNSCDVFKYSLTTICTHPKMDFMWHKHKYSPFTGNDDRFAEWVLANSFCDFAAHTPHCCCPCEFCLFVLCGFFSYSLLYISYIYYKKFHSTSLSVFFTFANVTMKSFNFYRRLSFVFVYFYIFLLLLLLFMSVCLCLYMISWFFFSSL